MTQPLLSAFARRSLPAWYALALAATPAAVQAQGVELTLHGGFHAVGLDRPERTLEQPGRDISIQSAPGEATALGLRLSTPLSGRWLWDAGLVWSRNRSVNTEDIEATIYSAMGINWTKISPDDPFGRGFEYVPFSEQDVYGPINELWG